MLFCVVFLVWVYWVFFLKVYSGNHYPLADTVVLLINCHIIFDGLHAFQLLLQIGFS